MTDSTAPRPASSGPLRRRLRMLWADRIDPHGYLGLHLAIGLAVAALAIWLFGALLDAVLANETMVRWDMAADLAIHDRMTPPSLRAVDVVTQLGSPTTMAILCVVVAVVLWRARLHTILWGWLAAFGGGAVIGQILKTVVHRTRPVYGAVYLHGHSYSFPSGHAMGSMIGYGMSAYLVRHVWHAGPLSRRLAAAVAVILVLAIGTSRILLGVHYPSDVVGGWAAGLAWMTICITGMEISEERRRDRAASSAMGTPASSQHHSAR